MYKNININKIDSFVISMKELDDNKMNNLKKLFPNTKFKQAVIGKNVNIDNKKMINPLVKYQIDHKEARNSSIYPIPSLGGIGCYLSHIQCMKWSLENNKPLVVIEEDVKFNDKSIQIIRDSFKQIPLDCDFLSIMYQKKPVVSEYNKIFDKTIRGNYGNQCYLIFPKGAKFILEKCLPITTQIDVFIGIILDQNKDFNGYCLKNKLYTFFDMIKDNFNSNIQNFAIKKYLPTSNLFYIISILIFIVLIVVLIIYMKKFYKILNN